MKPIELWKGQREEHSQEFLRIVAKPKTISNSTNPNDWLICYEEACDRDAADNLKWFSSSDTRKAIEAIITKAFIESKLEETRLPIAREAAK